MTTALDPLDYRRVVGRFATGITVVTTLLGDERHAMTCSSFTSVSLDPLLVLFCAEKIARFHDAVLESGSWAVSVLAAGQQHLSRHFAHRGRDLAHQFDAIACTPGTVTGAPVLDAAIASLECQTVNTMDGGDHTVVLGRVLALGEPAPGAPLLYYASAYHDWPAGTV